MSLRRGMMYSLTAASSIVVPDIENGNFSDGLYMWTQGGGGGWTIESGGAKSPGSTSPVIYQYYPSMQANFDYKISFDIIESDGSGVHARIGYYAPGIGTTRTAVGSYSEVISTGSDMSEPYLYIFSDGINIIDNVKIEHV